MSKYKGRIETSKRGFIPQILGYDDEYEFVDQVLDNAYVEYGTGCWVDTSNDPDVILNGQYVIYDIFNDGVPEDHFVFNTCNDFRVCYNPNCLAVLETPEFDWDLEEGTGS